MKHLNKKKICIISIVSVTLIIIIVAVMYNNFKHPNINMNFDSMRNPTEEENHNSGYNRARMAADENYVCFGSKKYGLVCYDIHKKEYSVLDFNNDIDYLSLQIYDGELYYKTYRYNIIGDVVKVNLKSKESSVVLGYFESVLDYFVVKNKDAYIKGGTDGVEIQIMHDGVIKNTYMLNDFVLIKDNIYGIPSYKSSYPDDQLIRINMTDGKEYVLNYIQPVSKTIDFKVHDDKAYIFEQEEHIDRLSYIVSENEVKPFENDVEEINSCIFYKDYIITDVGIYSKDGELLAKFNFDYDVYPPIQPTMVGGNVYFYSEKPQNYPSVGEGWYKIDVEKYIKDAVDNKS